MTKLQSELIFRFSELTDVLQLNSVKYGQCCIIVWSSLKINVSLMSKMTLLLGQSFDLKL